MFGGGAHFATRTVSGAVEICWTVVCSPSVCVGAVELGGLVLGCSSGY